MKVNVEQTRVEMTQIVLPPHANALQTAFGGQIAAWIDICAAVSAQRFSRGAAVTASIDELVFLEPVRVGMIVVLRSQVNAAWGSSMEIGVRVETEEATTGQRQHCCSAYLTFVALDPHGRKRALPELDVSGDPEFARRATDALERRTHRLEVRERRRSSPRRVRT